MSTSPDALSRVPDRDALVQSGRLAVFLSAAACPGLGQYVQRRWIAGTAYLLAFLGGMVMTILAVMVPLMTNLRAALDFAQNGAGEPMRNISMPRVLGWLGVSLLVYVAALADTIAVARRRARQAQEARRKALEPGGG